MSVLWVYRARNKIWSETEAGKEQLAEEIAEIKAETPDEEFAE